MASPAERYARFTANGPAAYPQLTRFAAALEFPLDDFQVRACRALEDGRGVLVAAPTGAGKTVVGEFAVDLALAAGRKAFYTTPIKALSNQKHADLVRRYGAENVGLLTGDSSINGEAPVVVMTTEVLRNMMYAGSPTLAGLGHVVMDEVHYLADRFRGAVWEEVIIHLPDDVVVTSLSATVSNAEEFGAWLGQVRGRTEVVVEEHRPVPLWQHMLVGRDLFDLFVEEEGAGRGQARLVVNPELVAAVGAARRSEGGRGRLEDAGAPRGRRGRTRGGSTRRDHRPQQAPDPRGQRAPGRPRPGTASRAEVIDRLDRDGLLPAITFIFSRAGCDAAVRQLLTWGTRLVPDEEAEAIRRHVESRVAGISPEDLGVLGYWDFVEAATRGFAAHHAGMLPTFREIVEELFTAGRIKAVFATETLALGINMPARTVVIEKLVKFNGQTHADITPAEYTQLTGRAGRRGIDVEGHAVVQWNTHTDPLSVAGLASTRTYPLRSSFRPTSNMAVNLVDQVGRARAREVLETSFAQFQADRSVVGLNREIRRADEALAGYSEAMTCHMGDFGEYASLRAQISGLEKQAVRTRNAARSAALDSALAALTPGDVIDLEGRRGVMRAVVVAAPRGRRGVAAAPAVVTQDARLQRLNAEDLDREPRTVGRIRLPARVNTRNPKERRDLAATMRATVPEGARARDDAEQSRAAADASVAHRDVEARIAQLRRELKAHPCHACPDREHHARWGERYERLSREREALRRKAAGRSQSVARAFDRICRLLTELGYLGERGESVTPAGHLLARIYTERDLLTAQCLRTGVFDGLDPAGLAAAVSCLIHEPRREGEVSEPPPEPVAAAHDAMLRAWDALEERERALDLTPTGYPDPGLASVMYGWAAGRRLEVVLRDSELSAGDFVRRCKQTVDLLDQIASVAPTPALRRSARAAVDAVLRGVVAADRLD